jgi:hypothetical protein
MLDAKILKLMFKEEFRLQASFFNRSYFLTSSLVLMLFTFVMGMSLPLLRRAVAIEDLLLAAHWVILFYGFGVGGFALFGERILERRFGSISLLLGSSYTLPIRHRRLFFLFYIKDTMYYILFTILPLIIGLIIASGFVSISLTSLFMLFISLSMAFLLGISFCVMLFTFQIRWGSIPVMVLVGALVIYLIFIGVNINGITAGLPPLVFYHSHSILIILEVLAAVLLFMVISFFLTKEIPMPYERKASENYKRTAGLTSKLVPEFSPLLAKDIMDLIRSRMIFPVVFTFLMPLIFLYALVWFIESVILLNLKFSLLFFAVMVGLFCTLLYSWLSNIDISECYNSLPLSMPFVIKTKIILFFFLNIIVAVPYLIAVGLLKGEIGLLWISLLLMLTVSTYVGSVVAYLTGLFTNSYLLDAKILAQFALMVVPILVMETLLSFYYHFNNYIATFCIIGLGLLLVAASLILLSRLNNKWIGKMFRIA